MANMAAIAEQTLALNCPVGGHPIDSIVWEHNGHRIPYNHRQKMFPNGTVYISNIERAADEGQYKCIAMGKDGRRAQNSLQVKILNQPAIDAFVESRALRQGQRYSILCSVSQGDLPLTIRWYKDDKEIKGTDMTGISVIHVSQFTSNLLFDALRPQHRGNYTCRATNAAGFASYSSLLTIHVPPKWVLEPVDFAALEGQIAAINCQAEGYPIPSVRWARAEESLDQFPVDYKPLVSSPHMQVYENGSLVIHGTKQADEGFYQCHANNGVGFGLNKVVRLTINVAPHFESKFTVKSAQKDNGVQLECIANGDRPIKVTWMKDKLPLDTTQNARLEVTENASDRAITSGLIIKNVTRHDSSLFNCIATNAHGSDETSIQLIVQEPPDPPLDIRITEIDGRSAKISWSPPFSGNSPITHYVVQHKALQDDWSSQTGSALTISGTESNFRLRNLHPVTSYQLRLMAANAVGKSEPSSAIDFTMDEEDPPEAPLLKVTGITVSSIKLSWSIELDTETNSSPSGYLLYHRKANGASDWQEMRLSGDISHNVFDFLACGTKYQFYIVAFNVIGKSRPSQLVTAKTEGMVPVAPHKNYRFAVNATTATIRLDTWHDGSCPISSFSIAYRQQRDTKWTTVDRIYVPDQRLVTLADLIPGTAYETRIIAFNEAGQSEARDTFTTISIIKGPATVFGSEEETLYPITVDFGFFMLLFISLCIVFLVILIVRGSKKMRQSRPANSLLYGSSEAYDTAKCNNQNGGHQGAGGGAEAIRMSNMMSHQIDSHSAMLKNCPRDSVTLDSNCKYFSGSYMLTSGLEGLANVEQCQVHTVDRMHPLTFPLKVTYSDDDIQLMSSAI
ncbi:Down syndrome cell adhesion molecule-like protein 1 -like protein [Halotydeus destructor]|nr:Down syndrome cell adhesion molecule-like protein 1 -like protein [Halotydeus destructor]